MTDSETYRNPEAFHKMLAAESSGEEAPEKATAEEEAPEAEEEQEEAGQEEAPEAAEEASEEEEQEEKSEEEEDQEEELAAEEEEDEEKPVPPSRLKKEITKRRAAEEESQKFRQRLEQMEEQNQLLNKMVQEQLEQAKAPKDEPKKEKKLVLPELELIDPDETLEPEVAEKYNAALKKLHDSFSEAAAEQQEKLDKLESQLKETNTGMAKNYFASAWESQARDFTRETPEFQNAMNHMLEVKLKENLALVADEREAKARAFHQIQQIAAAAVRNGENAPKKIYELAKAYGFRPKPAEKRKEPDPRKVAENRKKSESVASIPGAPRNPLGIYATKEGFEKLRVAPGKKIDPAKFAQFLKRDADGKFVA